MAEPATRGSKSGGAIPPLSDQDLDRFWSKVLLGGECWPWQGSGSGSGYGGFSYGPRATCRTLLAHRIAYSDMVGPIPDGMTISHLCHNRRCVRPSHLVAEPIQKNLERSIAGEKHRDARLSEDQVISMRWEYRAGGITYREIAERYCVSEATIAQAIVGRTWKHLREGL